MSLRYYKNNNISNNEEMIQEKINNNFLSVIKVLLMFAGMLPPESCYSTSWKMYFYNLYTAITIFLYFPHHTLQLIQFYVDWGNIDAIAIMIFEIAAPLNNLIVTIYLTLNRKRMRDIIIKMMGSFGEIKEILTSEDKHESILVIAAGQIRHLSLIVTVTNVITFLLYIVKPMYLWSTHTQQEINDKTFYEDKYDIFACRTWLPPNATQVLIYPIIWVYHAFLCFQCIMGWGGYNLLFCALITFAVCHFKILIIFLQDVNELIIDPDNPVENRSRKSDNSDNPVENRSRKFLNTEECKNERNCAMIELEEELEDVEEQKYIDPIHYLSKCIKYHQTIIEFCKELDDLYNPLMLIVFGMNGAMMCTTAFRAADISLDQDVSKFLSAGVTCWITLLLICWYGEKLTEESSAVQHTAFGCKWYHSSTNLKKHLMNIIMRAQEPVILTIGRLYPISLQGYASVANNVYAYFTVLKRMKE